MKELYFNVFSIFIFFLLSCALLNAQCPPTITATPIDAEITIDDFSKYAGGVSRYGITYVEITAGVGCTWDLYMTASVTPILYYSATGADLSLNEIYIRAINGCQTPDQVYVPPAAPATRVTGTFTNNLAVNPDYIIGQPIIVDGPLASSGPCGAATIINQNGNPTVNSTTHRFKMDIRVVPGIAPVIRPGIYDLDLSFFAEDDAGILGNNTAPFTLRIEVLPVMELKMNTSSQINFNFDNIRSYTGGVTKYGATILTVSSTVTWDLVAVATSTNNENGNAYWDENIAYSSTGTNQIPLHALELHQTPPNPAGAGAGVDYSPAFVTPPIGNNSIEVGSQAGGTTIAWGTAGTKAIAGQIVGGAGVGTSVAPGSNLPTGLGGSPADCKYVIDYRLVPGLPPLFPAATFPAVMGVSARPGSYTMEVRYILTEDQ